MQSQHSLQNISPVPWTEILPDEDLAALGLSRGEVCAAELLRFKSGHFVCRLKAGRSWRILKGFDSPDVLEPQVYALLRRYEIPTLSLHGCTRQALLLEDLAHSRSWRNASAADMRRRETGLAVADWYHRLHTVGREALRHPEALPPPLHAWVDELMPAALSAAGIRLGLAGKAAWEFALRHAETLCARARACPQTFNYEDFARENLAVSRRGPRRAVVFDYDCFTLGMAYSDWRNVTYSDWRNVTYSLEGPARESFIEAYGSVSEIEARLDLPLSNLHGLVLASRRENVPGWARPLLESVENGELERSVSKALE